MKIPIKISRREKKVLLVGGIIAILLISYQLFEWYRDFRNSMKEYSETKRFNLERQLNRISGKAVLEKRFKTTEAELKEIEKGLLPGDKPPISQAELQRLLKEMALSLNIEIKTEKTLTPLEAGQYIGVPVEIGFIATTAKLKDILYKIKTSPYLLTVSGINIRVTNIQNPVDAYTTLVVKGFIKKTKTEGKDKKEGSSAS